MRRRGRGAGRAAGGRGSNAGGGPANDRGQGLVEFIIVLPLLLVLVFGIIEFGNAWRTYQVVTNTAREGARQAVLSAVNQDSVTTVIRHRLTQAHLDPDDAEIVYSCNGVEGSLCTSTGDADGVLIRYPYTFRFFGPALNLMCAGCGDGYGTFTLSTQTTMRTE